MKTLIVEDDFTSRLLLQEMLKEFGDVHVATNGDEALEAVKVSHAEGVPYDLICLDIMMAPTDGQTGLRQIRAFEESRGIRSKHGAKIVMTTSLSDMKNVMQAYSSLCDGYLNKPIDKALLIAEIKKHGLI